VAAAVKKPTEHQRWVKLLGDNIGNVAVATDPAAAENCEMLICRLVTDPLLFPDNKVGRCQKCLRPVQFRPHAPKKPPKMCDECARPIVEKLQAEGNLGAFITPNTALDIANYLAKKKMN
jgi:hypothetical protein